jgi:hypothetical protein
LLEDAEVYAEIPASIVNTSSSFKGTLTTIVGVKSDSFSVPMPPVTDALFPSCV